MTRLWFSLRGTHTPEQRKKAWRKQLLVGVQTLLDAVRLHRARIVVGFSGPYFSIRESVFRLRLPLLVPEAMRGGPSI